MTLVRGTDLPKHLQEEAKASFIYRFTGEHRPLWASRDQSPMYRDDNHWLAHTQFHITVKGKIAKRKSCISSLPRD